MTGRNPNVFYEVGYAHALDKRVILLTQKVDDIPFDLKNHQHIVYENSIKKLQSEPLKWVEWAIEHPKDNITRFTPPIQFFINRVPLVDNPQFTYIQDETKYNIQVLIDAYNSADRGISLVAFQLCIISSDLFPGTGYERQEAAQLPESGRMHVFKNTYEIPPGGWESNISLVMRPLGVPEIGSEHQFVLRMLTDGKPADFPFRILIIENDKK